MKKIIMLALILGAVTITKAQTTNHTLTEHDPSINTKDSTAKADIIDPAEQAANGEAPDWNALTQTITQKYDAVTADRTITKAKIYFYYGKDWPAFCAAIVHYTNKYELANDYQLLNTNAAMILKNSDDKAQLTEALRWAKAALDSDPNNDRYKSTYNSLTAKISGN
jgi:hypothetical protein